MMVKLRMQQVDQVVTTHVLCRLRFHGGMEGTIARGAQNISLYTWKQGEGLEHHVVILLVGTSKSHVGRMA